MGYLSLLLLGSFEAQLDDRPVTNFRSMKARALLAYLVIEADRAHRRESLATLLWPEKSERVAHNNLRNTLSNLRNAIGDRTSDSEEPFLLVTRETVQFNCASDCWLDVHAFREGINATGIPPLVEAVALYRGAFLEGFNVCDSVAYADWTILVRDRLQRQAALTLQRLVDLCTTAGDYERASAYAWRWVELEPWQEHAYQHLMRVLALNGQRSTALAQYEVCRAILMREFGVEPALPTQQLYAHIRDGLVGLEAAIPNLRLGSDLLPATAPVFVAREQELTQLTSHLQQALAGKGHAVFVTGEAGQGKTLLSQVFAQRAKAALPSLVVAKGNCNAYTGIGDPYLPFREILEALVNVANNTTIQALLDEGPDLIDVFIPGATLRKQVTSLNDDNDLLAGLNTLIERKRAAPPGSGLPQEDHFRQYTAVLRTLAQQFPLLLLIDDMQWADLGSISLLFHLGRYLDGVPMLIVGAYRSEEVALGRNGKRHPLAPLVSEFRRQWGKIEVDLHQAGGNSFVLAYLDTEPNHLGSDFRTTLATLTGGHPLFTVELWHGMRDRGDVVQDADGAWIEGGALNWDILPARIEAVLEERISRLSETHRQTLRIASVEGEVFSAEIIAHIMQCEDDAVIADLSGALNRDHRLVYAQGIEHTPVKPLSRYRFRHILIQKYLFSTLDQVERSRVHRQIALTLLEFYGEDTQAIDAQVAWHFEWAGVLNEAVDHYHKAGETALRMSANSEAIVHLQKAIALIGKLPHSKERDERELALQLAYTVPVIALRSWGAVEAIQAYDRVIELSLVLGNTPEILQGLMLRQYTHTTHAEHGAALQVAEQFDQIAQRLGDPLYDILRHQELGVTLMFVGRFTESLEHLKHTLTVYDFDQHSPLAQVFGTDLATMDYIFSIYNLWYLGYPDQALQLSREGSQHVERLGHVFSELLFLAFKTRMYRWRREPYEVLRLADIQMAGWHEHQLGLGKASALQEQAWILSERGQPENAIPMFREALELWPAAGMRNHYTEWMCVLADMYAKVGQPEKGLTLLEEAIAFIPHSHELYHEAELYRMRGLLRLQQDRSSVEPAEADFETAIQVAQRMHARMCELRATTCLARLWQQQGKLDGARQRLSAIYDWFTEGFDTLDLQEAKALLDALGA